MLNNFHTNQYPIVAWLITILIIVGILQIPIQAVAEISNNIPGSWEVYEVNNGKLKYNKNQLWALAGEYREIHMYSNGTLNLVFKGKNNQTGTFY